MQKLKLTLLFAFILSVTASAQFSSANLQATGLTCALCSNAINKSLKKLSFVDAVEPNIKNSTFNITFKANEAVNIDAIKEAVEDAGFSVGGLSITGKFDNIKVENDKHVQIGNSSFHFLNSKEQLLSGEKTINIVDKDFISAKQFKKIAGSTKMNCIQTGKATADCCTKDGIKEGARVYHATI